MGDFFIEDNRKKVEEVEIKIDLIERNVLSKNGRVTFTVEDEIKEIGNLVLKTRY